ncbi:hypothetical protein ACFSSC_00070 [Corynebacterium mendelii]
MTEFQQVLLTCFGFDEHLPGASCAWDFHTRTAVAGHSDYLHMHLKEPGDKATFVWGLWQINLEVIDCYVRDDDAPRTMCIGGTGGLFTDEPDIDAINAKLSGSDSIRATLSSTRTEVRELIGRSGIFDFIPLLQALKLSDAVNTHDHGMDVLDTLPVEEDPMARDAFWVTVMALASLADPEIGNLVTEDTMQALGWTGHDGQPLTAAGARGLCTQSLRLLEQVGGYGTDAESPVARLGVYRRLLAAGECDGTDT